MKQYKTMEGLEIPRAAMGCMRIAEMEYQALESLVMTAVENGMNFFDHADFYGDSMSEVRFGEVLKKNPSLRDKIILQSKCGIRTGFYDSSYEHIMYSVDKSLEKMNTDHLDCLLLHRPDVLVDTQGVAKAFDELEKAGKVSYFGVSNHNPMQTEVLQKAVKQRLVFNQMQLSIMHTSMIDHGFNVNTGFEGAVDKDNATLEYCKLKDMVLQAWSPFQYGFFEGVFIDNPKFPKLNAVMDKLTKKYEVSKTALAVAWLVRIPAMVQVISGTTNQQRLLEIIKGSELEIERCDWYEIYREAGNRLP